MKTILALLLIGPLAAFAAEKPHAVFVVGTDHYAPEKSMPLLAQEMEKHGFRSTVILPKGNPEQNKNKIGITGLEVLDEADIVIFFMRFLALSDEQLKPILDYVESGKPVVGFRTSTHAFLYPKGHPNFKWNNNFGRDVLGTRYVSHQSGPTEAVLVKQQMKNPILSHVDETEFPSAGTLYNTCLQPGCVPLVLGTGKRKGERLVTNQFGTYLIQETEKDIIAWTWENPWGAKVFCSSFGHVGDFKIKPIMRIIVNGICWAADQPIPGADADIGTYELAAAKKQKKLK